MDEDVLSEDNELDGSETVFMYDENGEIESLDESSYQPQDLENPAPSVWSIQSVWNKSVEFERREPKVRDYISFSDLGKTDYWSRYMKMTGVPETNKFDPRVLRIFQAGDEFHNLIKTVLKKAGVFINSQDDLDSAGNSQPSIIEPTETTLKLFGFYDIRAGGKPNIEKARKYIEESDLSQFARQKAWMLAEILATQFPNGLEEMLYEVKSINSMAFWGKKNYLYRAYPHHRMQLYGYLVANNIPQGRLLYVSKDDLTLAEFPVYLNDASLREAFKKDVETMSYHILNKIEPPKPPYVVYKADKWFSFQANKTKYRVQGAYEMNWEVARSPYFTLMTGLQTSKELELLVKEEVSTKNQTIKQKVCEKVGIDYKPRVPRKVK